MKIGYLTLFSFRASVEMMGELFVLKMFVPE
jgi:hypothetical protein